MFGISKSIVKNTKGILDKAYASEGCVKSATYRVRRELKDMGLLFNKSRLSDRNYVSKYARSYTQEDFAETFMLFLKYKGVLLREFSRRKAIWMKWETVETICKDIAKIKKKSGRITTSSCNL